MCSLQHLNKLLSSLTTLAVGRLCRRMKICPIVMHCITDSHFLTLAILVNNAYNITCKLRARHTAASITPGGQIFILSAHCTPKGTSPKLSFLVIVWLVTGDGVALLFGILLNSGFGNLAG